MRLKQTSGLVITLIAILSIPVLAVTTLIRTLVSESGQTRVKIELYGRESVQRGAKIGSYKQAGGAGGDLISIGIDSSDMKGLHPRFQDTSGAERCVGRVDISTDYADNSVYNVQAVWRVDGAVRGYRCSTVGQTVTMKMKDVTNTGN